MKVLVDQSGKIEETSKITALAFSNGKNNTIKITAKTKRQLQEMFRRRGQGRLFIIKTFSVLLYLLLKDYATSSSVVVVDLEYPGHERLIKDILSELFGSEMPIIEFKSVGDSCKAHYLANSVFNKKTEAKRLISLDEVGRLAFRNRK